MKLRKAKRSKARLEARIKEYENSIKKSSTGGTEYTKPGSQKK